ncbi:MAG: hypothetical protein KDC34_15430 [Saprospiraceae bacterium]|nr:hypothetical protein [Saprospiraceae bacterium]
MSYNQRTIIVLGVLGLLLTLVFYIFGGNTPRQDWQEHYRSNSKSPYGTFVIHELLSNYFSNEPFENIETRFDSIDFGNGSSNYVYIGNQLSLDSISFQAVIRFVEAGNTALLATNELPFKLIDQLFPYQCDVYDWLGYEWEKDSSASVRVWQPEGAGDWEVQVRYHNNIVEYAWSFIPESVFCETDNQEKTLGQIWEYQDNFVLIEYETGQFLFHSNPILFTNYFLKDTSGFLYAQQVFSWLEEGPVFWDNYSIINSSRRNPNAAEDSRSFDGEGPLSYILSEKSLAWAWYLTLGGMLLFLIFRAKRKQRVIPVLEPNRNTSLEFITSIGRLYFVRPNHRKLALEQMRLFLLHVRSRYHLYGRDADDTFIDQLSTRSGIDREVLKSIIQIHQNIKGSPSISEVTLINFHNKLEYFYQNCK